MTDGLTADELFTRFMFGQSIVIRAHGPQLDRGVMDFVERSFVAAVANGDQLPASPLSRYLNGELTNGTPPRDWITMHLNLRANIEMFAAGIELLRLQVDGGTEDLRISGPDATVLKKIRDGVHGPFVMVYVDKEPRVFCWCCRDEIAYDLAVCLSPVRCPSCQADSVSSGDGDTD